MFYNIKQDSVLSCEHYKSCIIPRPIGWISTISNNGAINIAPFSYFNAISDFPAMVMFSACSKIKEDSLKDTVINIKNNQEFVVNIATFDLKNEMNISSNPLEYGVSEADFANIELAKSHLVNPPRIAKSPINLECKLYQIIDLPALLPVYSNSLVIGEVVGVNIDDDYIINDKIDIAKIKPIARLGYKDYALIDNIFTMQRK
jgi:flavin reductase (DIM6/NTAB) family NADH-FMN oxidoreductase RutF